MSRTGRAIVSAGAVAAILYVAASVVAGIFLADSALHPTRRPLSSTADSQLFKNVSIVAADGATLRGWYLRPQVFSGSSVILLHGMADNREGVLGYAQMFLRHGYAVLMPDSRAHGESGGNIASYGVIERNDVKRWAEWLRSQTPDCEYLFGESMGAAIAIQASHKTPDLCAVVAEDAFEDFREIAYDRVAQQTGMSERLSSTLGWPTVEAGFLYAQIRYRVRLSDANPMQIATDSHVPVLLITGTADSNIPMRHSIALNRAAPDHTYLWIVDGAGHTGAMQANPGAFERRVIDWFNTHDLPVSN